MKRSFDIHFRELRKIILVLLFKSTPFSILLFNFVYFTKVSFSEWFLFQIFLEYGHFVNSLFFLRLIVNILRHKSVVIWFPTYMLHHLFLDLF